LTLTLAVASQFDRRESIGRRRALCRRVRVPACRRVGWYTRSSRRTSFASDPVRATEYNRDTDELGVPW